jgi:excisionase family DNA binding protein
MVVGPRDAAALLGEGKDKTYARIRSGELPSWTDGRNRRIDVADIRALIERKKAEAQSGGAR